MPHIFKKRNITPIIIPQILLTNPSGIPNSLVDMNPSMYIDGSGEMQILVRCVNYRKFKDKSFMLLNNEATSQYLKLVGQVNEGPLDLDKFSLTDMTYEYNRQTYGTYWLGPEDIRFLSKNTILATVPECNPKGNPSIFKANLLDSSMRDFTPCLPDETEKNWMPFYDLSGNAKVVYSIYPFKIKDVDTENFIELASGAELCEYHGSTNGIEFGSDRLFLIHINEEQTLHRWLRLHLEKDTTGTISVSQPFVFFEHSYIEFPVSLAKWENRLFVSLGVNDYMSYIIELDINDIKTA